MLEILEGYDWQEAFGYAGEPGTYGEASVSPCVGTETPVTPFTREDVVEVIASKEGENDGPNWKLLGRLSDGRFFFLSAGCDYTGWDCQAGGGATVDTSLAHLIQFGIGQDDRDDLGLTK